MNHPSLLGSAVSLLGSALLLGPASRVVGSALPILGTTLLLGSALSCVVGTARLLAPALLVVIHARNKYRNRKGPLTRAFQSHNATALTHRSRVAYFHMACDRRKDKSLALFFIPLSAARTRASG